MEEYKCECGTVFYRNPKKMTACPNCMQVVWEDDSGYLRKVFI